MSARPSRRLGKAARRWLILGHRWLGVGTGLLFALWIGSGLVMLYVPFPALTAAERLGRLAPIAWDRVAVGPDAALAAAGIAGVPDRLVLEMRGPEPVYRVADGGGRRAVVSAASGLRLGPVGPEEAAALAGGVPGVAGVERVERDQWTVTARYDPLRPFYKVAPGDAAGTELYVSRATGEIALDTTRSERAWNWVGAVVHWVYLTPLRARAELWRQAVLWLSGIAALTACSGLAIGVWRARPARRYPNGSVTPYRGLARWHHLFGLGGGLGLALFILSGWLSMNPNRWFSSSAPPPEARAAYAGAPGPVGLDAGGLARAAGPGARAVRFAAIGSRWWLVTDGAGGPRLSALDGGAGPDTDTLAAAASGAVPGGSLRAVERLAAYDAYWYPHGADPRPLPILRLRFDDPAATWLHLDPADGAILGRLDRSGRANRWLFDAPHRLDLPGLTERPRARDAAQWLLNGLAAAVALTGLVAGWRRLVRRARGPTGPDLA